MKRKVISRIAAAVGMSLVVTVALPVVSMLNIFRASFAVSIPAPSDADSSATSEDNTTMEDVWNQFLEQADGDDSSIADLIAEEMSAESPSEDAASENAVSSEAAAGSTASSASSGKTASSALSSASSRAETAASSKSSSASQETSSAHIASSSHTAASSGSTASTPRNSCDEQLAQYIVQLEKLQKKSSSQLYSVIQEAYDEYIAYPEDKRSLTLKVSIVVSKGSKLTSLQSACDKEFNTILAQMRTCLKENGRDQKLADEAQKAYENAKSSMIKELTNIVYNTATGSGSGGQWIESHRNLA